MSALQLLLWARAVAPAVADQEGARSLANVGLSHERI